MHRASRAPDLAIEATAALQCGTFSRRQAMRAGLSADDVQTRLVSGRWRRVAPTVYGFPGHPETWLRRLWIAHLHAGPESVISHRSAARLQRLGPIEGEPVDLIVGRSQARSLPGTQRFRVTDLRPGHVHWIDGLPMTTPARTIVDLASVSTRARLARIVESSEVEGRCPLLHVATMLDDLRRRGKPGVRRLGDVLDAIGPGEALPRSELESLLDAVIDRAGLPRPRHEYPLPTTTDLSGFVDRCWPDALLIVEGDGRRWHTRRHQIALDHDRDLEAARRGYDTQRLIWERLRGDAEATATALREIYERRVDLLGRAG